MLTLDATRPPERLAAEIAEAWDEGRRMKIGITCYPTYGGSGAVATELGLELARRGHEVHFITYDSPFRLHGYAERIYFHQVETRMGRYPLFDHFPYTLALASKQHEVVLREGLEMLHVHYAIPHATTAYLAREMLKGERPLRVITTLHGTDITLVGQESSFYAITKFSIEQSDEVTAVSDYLRDETYRAFGCVSCDVRVIPNFVNLARVPARRSPVRASTLAPEGTKVITHVSNFREVKRVKDVVRVFARIRRAMPATLVMVGDGPDRVDAENEARELGVAEDVRFLGRLDSVASLLQASDLFLLPSQTESFGLAALEAMACGVAGRGHPRRRPARGGGRRRERHPRAGRLGRGDGPPRDRAAARSRRAMPPCARPPSPRRRSSPPTASCRCTRRCTEEVARGERADVAELLPRRRCWAWSRASPNSSPCRPPGTSSSRATGWARPATRPRPSTSSSSSAPSWPSSGSTARG